MKQKANKTIKGIIFLALCVSLYGFGYYYFGAQHYATPSEIPSFKKMLDTNEHQITKLETVCISETEFPAAVFPKNDYGRMLKYIKDSLPEKFRKRDPNKNSYAICSMVYGEILIHTQTHEAFKLIVYTSGLEYDSYFWPTPFSQQLRKKLLNNKEP